MFSRCNAILVSPFVRYLTPRPCNNITLSVCSNITSISRAHCQLSPPTRMGSSSSRSFSPKNTPPANSSRAQVAKSTQQQTITTMADDYVEAVVCQDSELQENQMKSVDLGPGKVLLIKQAGEITALGHKCTHYGAPLVTGALGQGRVRCPWHGACFNIKTGDIEDFPGLDSLPCYQVSVEPDGGVKVRAKKSDLESNKRVKLAAGRSSGDTSTYLVIGGGPSAASCVETLRQNECLGRVVMIAKENALPYDRIKISKMLDAEIDKLQFRDDDFYAKNAIEVCRGVEVTKVDTHKKSVTLSDGETMKYTSVFIATGSKSRLLPIPGNDLKNVFTLRTITDGNRIFQALGPNKDKNVVVLGVSFIGMEAAAYFVGKTKSVTVIGRDDVPFLPVFGREVGARLMKLFVEKGVQFKMNNNIKACCGTDGVLTSVELTDGCELPADILVMGVGSMFNTTFLKDSGIQLEQNGSVTVNDRLETNVSGVYAGGDIACAPVYSHGGVRAPIGHIGLSQYHGKVAALNMLNMDMQLKAVPFFWTLLFGKSVRYCGFGKFHSIRIDGSVEELKFVAFYFDESGKVIAVASCGRDPVVAQFAEYLAQGKSLHRDDLECDLFGWTKSL